MKKNITVNINGFLYNIDEDAYEKLQSYIERLKKHFQSHSGHEEIIQDIEDRISEMMRSKIAGGKNAINIEDVNEIIQKMGEPWEFESDDSNPDFKNENQNNTNTNEHHTYSKRFFRDPDEKMIAGVASGVSAYINVDPMWIRLAFVALFFMGPGFFIYIILWIVLPEAKTTAQKLEMKGEPITIENIEKTIKDEFQNIQDKVKDIKKNHKGDQNIFEKIAHVIVNIFSGFIRVLGIFIGVIFTIVAIVIIVALIPSFLNTDGFFVVGNSNILFFSMQNFFELVFNSKSDVYLTLTALAIVIGMPLLGMIIQGIKLIFGIKKRNYFMGTTFVIVWLTGFLLLVISAVKMTDKFKVDATDQTIVECSKMKSDTLFLQLKYDNSIFKHTLDEDDYNFVNSNFLYLIDSNNFSGLPKFICDRNSNEFSILLRKVSKGKNFKQAKRFAREIQYQYSFEDSLFTISPLFNVPKSNKWRAQQMEIVINIPEGKYLKIVNDSLLNEQLQIQLQSSKNNYFYLYPEGNEFVIRNGFKKHFISSRMD